MEFSIVDLIVLALATYRLSVMFSNDWEVGPFGLLSKFREKAGLLRTPDGDIAIVHGSFIDGFMCTHCNSVWIGLAFTLAYGLLSWLGLPAYLLFLPLALSGANIIIVKLME